MLRQFLTTCALFSGCLFGQVSGLIQDQEDQEQAGTLQFRGITEADEVRIDGEVVNAKGLARSKYVLLLAPGTYEISVTARDSGKRCTSEVTVLPAEKITPACARQRVRMARGDRPETLRPRL
jgi:hypothetical protein